MIGIDGATHRTTGTDLFIEGNDTESQINMSRFPYCVVLRAHRKPLIGLLSGLARAVRS